METRIEIYKDDMWQALRLEKDAAIKYNAVINKIGKVATREISHTNTFSLPHVHHNLQVLGLNVFNPKELAKAMNSKYIAKYYVEDKLLQSGFIVINNTNQGKINVNFVDESLDLVGKWGSTTFQELLQSNSLDFPSDYATAISELREYDMDKTALLTKLPQVGTRGYALCSFPNSLNTIGDKFQLDQNELRQDDVFNSYQSRPLFNVKSLFDLATESFGYTPIYDDSVDWDLIEETFIVNDGQDQSLEGENGVQTIQHPFTSPGVKYITQSNFGIYNSSSFFTFSGTSSLKPNDVANWTDSFVGQGPFGPTGTTPWRSQNTLFVPDTTAGNVGTLHFIADVDIQYGGSQLTYIWAFWKNATPGGAIIQELLPPTNQTAGSTYQVDITLDKTQFDTVPSGASELIGIMFEVSRGAMSGPGGGLTNMNLTETFLPEGVVAFDKYGQFLPDDVDLSYNAPRKSIKSLLSSCMHKEGILMNINAKDKTVKFFNYKEYANQKDSGNFSDWSKYLLRYSGFVYNTDYGTSYAKKNRIGLSDPYQGNYYDIILENQGIDSKYKDFATDSVSSFKDVSNVVEVNNTNTPYFEYYHEGLGLVELQGTLGTLEQERANGDSEGNFTGLDHFANVNYGRIPKGVELWYELVDKAVRVEGKFLLPIDVVRSLDLSEPIYVEELGGFYIIEEIKEYSNQFTPVTVKLIKIPNNYGEFENVTASGTPQIDLSVYSDNTVEVGDSSPLQSTLNYYNYTPTSSTVITFKELTESGGEETGDQFTSSLNPISPYSNQTVTTNTTVTESNKGYYKVVATDSTQGISSNEVEIYLGNPTVQQPSVDISAGNNFGLQSGRGIINYSYNHFSANPTTAILEYQKIDSLAFNPAGTLRTVSFNTTPLSGSKEITFQDGSGFYNVQIKTNEVNSETTIIFIF